MKISLNSTLGKLYPLKEPNGNPLISAPVADASLMRLANHVMLPMEDEVTVRDVLDSKINLDLKRTYTAVGGACRPAITLVAAGKGSIQLDIQHQKITSGRNGSREHIISSSGA